LKRVAAGIEAYSPQAAMLVKAGGKERP